MSSTMVWNRSLVATTASTPASFVDIMSQQFIQDDLAKTKALDDADLRLAQELQHQEQAPSIQQPLSEEIVSSSSSSAHQQDEEDPDFALARKLQEEFNREAGVNAQTLAADNDDYLVALKMQADYDRAFNKQLTAKERHFNGNSKVMISLDNYRRPFDIYTSDDVNTTEEVDLIEESHSRILAKSATPAGEQANNTTPAKRPEIVTKHNIAISSRRNARRLESLPLSFNLGNTVDDPSISINNRVFNQVREHSNRSTSSRNKLKLHGKEDVSTSDRVLDARTRLMLFKMMSSGVLPQLLGIISSGKEANVYAGVFSPHALQAFKEQGGRPTRDEGEEEDDDEQEENEDEDDHEDGDVDDQDGNVDCAVKVFKTTLNEFKHREIYILDDFRFDNRMSRSNPRKFIALWAEKEMHNLRRLRRAGIRCPEVLLYEKHILVMSLIGKQGRPAQKLHQVTEKLSTQKLQSLFGDCLRMMRGMYQDAKLVHGDLSSYNILYYNGKLWIIDVSQAVVTSHPRAHEFLLRDCQIMSKFFASVGVEVLSPLEMLAYITFHPGQFKRADAEDGEEDDGTVSDDGDENWSDTDTASVTTADHQQKRRHRGDILDYKQEDAFINQIREDVAALVASHPSGVDADQNPSEFLSQLLPSLKREAGVEFPLSHLSTAQHRADVVEDEDDEEEEEEDEEEEEEDLNEVNKDLVAQLNLALTRDASVSQRKPTTKKSHRKH